MLINRVPRGLLGMLDLKALGQNPAQLLDTVSATIDLLQMYREEVAVEVRGTTNAVNLRGIWGALLSTGAIMGPPVGELWLLDGVSLNQSVALAAGTTYGNVRLGIYNIQTGALTRASPTAITATVGEGIALGWDGPIFVPPQYSLCIWAQAVTLGVAAQFNIEARVAKLKL